MVDTYSKRWYTEMVCKNISRRSYTLTKLKYYVFKPMVGFDFEHIIIITSELNYVQKYIFQEDKCAYVTNQIPMVYNNIECVS